MKRIARGLGVAAASVAAMLGFLCLRYSPEYVARVLRYGDSDVRDHEKFPARPVANGAEVFRFRPAADGAAAEARVRAAFGADEMAGGDLDAFLEATRTQAFLVVQDDAVLYERYFGEARRDALVTSFSVAKSFASALVGIAIAEGRIRSADEPITAHLPELEERDPSFARITLRDLLDMCSGIHYVEYPFFTADDALTYYFPDLRDLALNRTRIAGPPRERWLYNNYHPLLIGLILERATGVPVAAYLEEKLWRPLGMEYPGSWSLDGEATAFEKMESGINARAVDFAKLGRLYLRGGDWDGRRIVPREWVEASTRMDPAVDRARFYPAALDQPFGRIFHQRLWWGVEQEDGDAGFAAMGNHGQFVFVWPQARLVVVRNGETYGFGNTGFDWLGLFVRAAERLG